MRAALIRINTITANIIIMKKTAMTQLFNDVLPSPLMTSYTWPEALKSLFVQGRALEITFFAIQIHGRKRIGLVMANTFSGGNKGTMYLHKTIQ